MDEIVFNSNVSSSNDKKLIGLKDDGKVEFRCSVCNRLLLILQLTSTTTNSSVDVLTRVAVKCESCGDFSLVQQISGQFYPGAPDDNMAFDVLDKDEYAPQTDVLFRAWKKCK